MERERAPLLASVDGLANWALAKAEVWGESPKLTPLTSMPLHGGASPISSLAGLTM